MNAQNVEQILEVLAATFGTTATHLWEVVLRQVWVEFVTGMVFVVFAGVVGVAMLRIANNMELDSYHMRSAGAVLRTVLGCVLLFLGFITFWIVIGYPFNPEFYALSKILGAF